MRPVLLAILALLVCAAPASAGEQLLTLYSPAIESLPYVHRSEFVTLKADGKQAPAQAGSILGFQEMALVDSKRPDAKPLPVDKMMVHHFLYYAGGRVDRGPGGCLGDGFIGGRGEEHPSGRFDSAWPAELRARYGIRNATPEGGAPEWSLMTMVMNHYKRPKRFYVRTKVWYTTEPRQQVYPLTIGNCAHLANGMGYDVPGGGAPGSTYVDRSQWTVPFSGRILGGGSHHHGGALHQTLRSVSCGRTLFDAKAYYGADDHPYNTIRPILHEPGPIANGTFRTLQGIPVTAGEVLEREAVHSNEELHIAAMGFWATYFVRDDSVAPCGPMPSDLREVTVPAKYDQRAPYVFDRLVPQLLAAAGQVARVRRPADRHRRPVVQVAAADRQGRAEDHVGVPRRRAAQRERGQRAARLLVQLPRRDARVVLLHAHRAGHVQAHVPHPPDDDESDGASVKRS